MRKVPRLVSLSLVVLLLVALVPLPAWADEGEDREEAEAVAALKVGKEPVEMETFLRLMSRFTERPFVWNPHDKNIRGKKIMGAIDLTLPADRVFEAARALLTFYELVVIPVGPEGYELNVVIDARQTSSILKLKPVHVELTDANLARYEHQDGLFITTTIHVEHMQDLRNARNAFSRIVTGQNIGNVTEVPPASAFVVTDFAPNVVAIYRLIRRMDQPQVDDSTTGGRTVAVRLEHADARETAGVLNRHFGQPERNPRQPPQQQEPLPSRPRITADPRTNCLLVSGTEAEVARVKQAIALLDVRVAPKAEAVSAHVIEVEHADAEELADVLRDVIARSPTLWTAGGSRPAVLALEDRQALIVTAAQADLQGIRALIRTLDRP